MSQTSSTTNGGSSSTAYYSDASDGASGHSHRFEDDALDPAFDSDSEMDEASKDGSDAEDAGDYDERDEQDDAREREDERLKEEEQKRKDLELQKLQTDLRKRILQIQSDTALNPADKTKKIQELMTSAYNQKKKGPTRNITNFLKKGDAIDFDIVTDDDKQPSFHDKDQNILGCKHYQRAAKLQAHCCGKWYACRFCHDEISDHNIIRNLTKTMMCMYCFHVQPSGQVCVNQDCKRQVAKYYCSECKLWDNDPRKNIYHCFDCGICRIGKGLGQDYFHCKKCNVCMAISLKGRHKCIERNLESDCPICGEYMFTSTTTVIFMPCGHCIHYKCHQDYIQTSYQCPTCFKSLANMTEYFRRIDAMLAQHKMPPEYENWVSWILCNDCEKKSTAKYHFLYHKCGNCGSYNTKTLKTYENKADDHGSASESPVTADAPLPSGSL
ncbi:zf-CHY-domain-containing protein [Gonapodya prolifera JEL478]|uniref:Zf-CHY-domain-containing protein n=1 Tax=Gonapodya prolifera (strain JEL478) TaxID=1344416 RepID=A0A139AYW4_GONPJ|nr:zf-CHY-domain-containing protein [Gonapodya prolifera JEL478]|eukprot:KXS21655.1 zf-CHY-domain-containing protein [Gonapodya prolifera JEL478]